MEEKPDAVEIYNFSIVDRSVDNGMFKFGIVALSVTRANHIVNYLSEKGFEVKFEQRHGVTFFKVSPAQDEPEQNQDDSGEEPTLRGFAPEQ